MMQLLFVDTNVWLDAYRSRASTKPEDLVNLAQLRDHVITTDQLQSEFLRNLPAAVQDGIKSLGGSSWPGLVAHLHPEVQSARARLKKVHENHEHEPIWVALGSLCRTDRSLHLAEGGGPWSAIVSQAEDRKKLNKPPGKLKENSIGDHINWLWILAVCKARRASVTICSRDGDYGYAGDPGNASPALVQEFRNAVGVGYNVSLTTSLEKCIQALAPARERAKPVNDYKGSVPSSLKRLYDE